MLRHAVVCLALVTSAVTVRAATGPVGEAPPRVAAKPEKPAPEPPPDTSRKAAARPDADGAEAASALPRTERYRFTLVNVNTREVLPIGAAEALDRDAVARFLRCRVTGERIAVADAPVDVALRMAERFASERIEVISGYRSPKLNEALRKKGREVASRSLHMRGEALDFRIPTVPAQELARAIAGVHRGGIGTYAESGFVHVDVGRDRRWRGR